MKTHKSHHHGKKCHKKSHRHHKCNNCESLKDTDNIDTSIAVAKFHEDPRNPIKGKNVLIIGASKGNGNGAAVAFYNAGANVVGTSRAPCDYTGQPWLSPVPLDITNDASVENFFATEPTLNSPAWNNIHILVLSGNTPTFGHIKYMKPADFYPMINTEILGRQRVVNQVTKKMENVVDSRMITLSSLDTVFCLIGTGYYGAVKAAHDAWVRIWNVTREYFKELTGSYTGQETIAMSLTPSFVNTTFGELPPSLCNPEPVPQIKYAQYMSGMTAVDPSTLGPSVFLQNSTVEGLNHLDVGKAILYMATVVDPEWRYACVQPCEKLSFFDGTIKTTTEARSLTQYKFKDANLCWIRGYNWRAAIPDLVGPNVNKYSIFHGPPMNQEAPPTPVPDLPPQFPNCTTPPTGLFPPNITLPNWIDGLVHNPCVNDNPCSEQPNPCN